MPIDKVKEEVAAAIAPIIQATGNYLEDITIQSAGKRRMITVIVDSDTHLNLDQVTVVTKEISEVIENLTALGEIPFTLEVTSPGVDRPLTLPRHWAKNLGRLVKASLNDGGEVKGRIGQSTQVSVVIDEATISYADIKKAVLEVEFK
ncbi:MAG: hypothetical protein NTZ31_04615 [Actinobacteria bacterium]|jgi:ribosome maturation factor RimP|nr:hypothetical protein [Actinomycetota bacterium]